MIEWHNWHMIEIMRMNLERMRKLEVLLLVMLPILKRRNFDWNKTGFWLGIKIWLRKEKMKKCLIIWMNGLQIKGNMRRKWQKNSSIIYMDLDSTIWIFRSQKKSSIKRYSKRISKIRIKMKRKRRKKSCIWNIWN